MSNERELIMQTGEKFGEIIAQVSFDFWQDQTFRILINFESINKTEQDRIFNELEVSVLGLLILNLDNAIQTSKSDDIEAFYSMLSKASTNGFLNLYKKLNIPQKYIDEWKVLIDMRLEEYRKDFKVAQKESKSLKEIKEDPELGVIWAKVETITIDCLSHIRRGDVKPDDPLWKMLRKWFTMLEVTFDKLTLQLSTKPAAIS